MAKVFGPNQSPRAPSLRGAFLIRPGRSGQVAQGWPKPPKKRKSKKQQDAIAAFKEAAIIGKFAPAEDQMTARRLSHGSQFLPRDLQYMAIYGRLCTLFFTNGRRVYQLASRYDLTELLDILGFAPGSILFRGPEFWETLAAPEELSVLIAGGFNLYWQTPAEAGLGGGAASGASILGGNSTNTGTGFSKGRVFTPRESLRISDIYASVGGSGSSKNLTAFIAPLDGTTAPYTVIAPAAYSDPVPFAPTSPELLRFPFPDDTYVLGGVSYAFGVSTDNPIATADIHMTQGTGTAAFVQPTIPVDVTGGIIASADRVPTTGTTFTNLSTNPGVIWATAIPGEPSE